MVIPAIGASRRARVRRGPGVFTHGDLEITHVFADGDEITGVIDWEARSCL